MNLAEAIQVRAGELDTAHAQSLAAMRLALGALAINSNRTPREQAAFEALSLALARELAQR